jgi:hypothetical protein
VLKRLNLLAQRWLGHAEPLGGAAEMTFLGNGEEISQVAQFHARRSMPIGM